VSRYWYSGNPVLSAHVRRKLRFSGARAVGLGRRTECTDPSRKLGGGSRVPHSCATSFAGLLPAIPHRFRGCCRDAWTAASPQVASSFGCDAFNSPKGCPRSAWLFIDALG